MDILTSWLRAYLPPLPVDDRQLAEDLTLRGIAVEGEFPTPGGGTRFEMDITTNRVDAMNHYGVAREVAAIYDLPLAPLPETAPVPATAPDKSTPGDPYAEHGFPVRIDAPDLCGRFTARVVRGVTVRPATGFIAESFAALGQKPISGPVDVTNFGWLAMGQPTHVFDLDTLEGGLVIRRAHPGEPLKLLDGTERTLTPDDLVVADERKALALAGVMGGWDSRVTDATRNILVEAAWFDPAAIRASSRRHGLHTDASHRFERGADFNAPPLANSLVTLLLLEQAGGTVVGPLVDLIIPEAQARTAGRERVVLRVTEVQRLLGTTLEDSVLTTGQRVSGLDEAVVAQYLTALGCTLEPTGTLAGEFAVTLPSWRLDLEREIDLIEEVARVYGYNRFANTLPGWSGIVVEPPAAPAERATRTLLRSLGFSESLSSTFLPADESATFGFPAAVPLGNPLSDEAGVLRPTLLLAMAGILAKNTARDVDVVRLFELGTVFSGSTDTVDEHTSLALSAMGGAAASTLNPADDALLFEVKGALEALLAKFTGTLTLRTDDLPAWITPGRGIRLLFDGEPLGVLGELSPEQSEIRKLRSRCVLAELDATRLFAHPLRTAVAEELSRFPAVERDFSFLFPDTVTWSAVEDTIRGLNLPELRVVLPLEIFRDPRGKAVATGSYSLLFKIVLQSLDRTLTDAEISTEGERVTTALTALGGTQRAPDA